MKVSFADFDLPKQLNNALEKQGISEPTPIQLKSFSPIMSGKDVMGIAQTGTGKTLAYLLPVLKTWKYNKNGSPTVLILVPTRELVVQVAKVLENLTEEMTARVLGVYGGVNINTQKLLVYEGVDILVGTPGRVMDLMKDAVLNLKDLKKLVIDEFDEMLSLGFRRQLEDIFTMMSEKRQNILFSSIISPEVTTFADKMIDGGVEIKNANVYSAVS